MITYETIIAATQGDPVAAGQVLDYFDGYINQLCTHAFVDVSGHMTYGVDTYRKTQLQGKLLSAMMSFEP